MKKQGTAMHYAVALFLLLSGTRLFAQNFDVTAQFRLIPPATEAAHPPGASHSIPLRAVLWLTPVETGASDQEKQPLPPETTYTLIQKNKQFLPHLLVIPVGGTVMFPNQDPFFHNVFSTFNGRRFDLGLYEAGSTRGVRFSREGVSYIFCNIHPGMSAVVLTLSTRLFAIADAHNRAVVHDVPAGQYLLHVWSEGAERLDPGTRVVMIAANDNDLGTIEIPQAADLNAGHKNKFGKDYDTTDKPLY